MDRRNLNGLQEFEYHGRNLIRPPSVDAKSSNCQADVCAMFCVFSFFFFFRGIPPVRKCPRIGGDPNPYLRQCGPKVVFDIYLFIYFVHGQMLSDNVRRLENVGLKLHSRCDKASLIAGKTGSHKRERSKTVVLLLTFST